MSEHLVQTKALPLGRLCVIMVLVYLCLSFLLDEICFLILHHYWEKLVMQLFANVSLSKLKMFQYQRLAVFDNLHKSE